MPAHIASLQDATGIDCFFLPTSRPAGAQLIFDFVYTLCTSIYNMLYFYPHCVPTGRHWFWITFSTDILGL